MRILTVALSLTILSCCSALAQVSGTFYMDKDAVPLGQAAFLNFKVTNSGSDTYMLNVTGIPGMPLCAGYSINMLHQPKHPKPIQNTIWPNTCTLNGQFKYLPIAPGAPYIQKFDLSMYFDLRASGDYVIEARYGPTWTRESPPAIAPTKANLSFRIE